MTEKEILASDLESLVRLWEHRLTKKFRTLSDSTVEVFARIRCEAKMRQEGFMPKVFVSRDIRNFRIARCLALGDYDRWPIYSREDARRIHSSGKGGCQ